MSSMRIFFPPKVQASSPFLRKVCPRFLYSKRIAYLPFPLELKPPFFLNFSFIPRSYTIQNVSNGTLLPLRKSSFSTKGPVAAHMKKRRGAVTPTPVNHRRLPLCGCAAAGAAIRSAPPCTASSPPLPPLLLCRGLRCALLPRPVKGWASQWPEVWAPRVPLVVEVRAPLAP